MPATLGLYVRNREKHTDRERKKRERTTKVICNGGFNVLNKSVSMLINNQMAAFWAFTTKQSFEWKQLSWEETDRFTEREKNEQDAE